jgi:hypothetical protein
MDSFTCPRIDDELCSNFIGDGVWYGQHTHGRDEDVFLPRSLACGFRSFEEENHALAEAQVVHGLPDLSSHGPPPHQGCRATWKRKRSLMTETTEGKAFLPLCGGPFPFFPVVYLSDGAHAFQARRAGEAAGLPSEVAALQGHHVRGVHGAAQNANQDLAGPRRWSRSRRGNPARRPWLLRLEAHRLHCAVRLHR